jgi:DNA invertase Pin-like site-specific DNA recombinase
MIADRLPIAYGYCLHGQVLEWLLPKFDLERQSAALSEFYRKKLEPLGYCWGGVFGEGYCAQRLPVFFEREGGRDLNRRLRTGDAVVFPSISAVWRDTDEAATCLASLLRFGNVIGFVEEDLLLDSKSAETKLALTFLKAAAQIEFDRRSERSKHGHKYERQPKSSLIRTQWRGNRSYELRQFAAIVHLKTTPDPATGAPLTNEQIRALFRRLRVSHRAGWWTAVEIDRVFKRAVEHGVKPDPTFIETTQAALDTKLHRRPRQATDA